MPPGLQRATLLTWRDHEHLRFGAVFYALWLRSGRRFAPPVPAFWKRRSHPRPRLPNQDSERGLCRWCRRQPRRSFPANRKWTNSCGSCFLSGSTGGRWFDRRYIKRYIESISTAECRRKEMAAEKILRIDPQDNVLV